MKTNFQFKDGKINRVPYDQLSLSPSESYELCQYFAQFWWSDEKVDLPKELQPSSASTFFAGSFNPWHEGHQACVDLCPKEVIIVPDSNPQKEVGKRDYFREVIDLARRTGRPVYPGFIGGPANPTSKWFPFLPSPKNFLLGMDSFLSLKTWIDPEVFIKSVDKFFVVPRKESTGFEEMCEWVERVSSSTQVELLSGHAHEDVSSTEIRKNQN